jgi:ADP-ribosyl-[dinitrogen reductase] hydrolase
MKPSVGKLPSAQLRDRARGCAVGAAVADALGMPLEFGPRQPAGRLVRDMQPGRLPAGTFTDDTEMALALADSHLHCRPLDPADLAQRFGLWLHARPPDVGTHTRHVLSRFLAGEPWEQAVSAVQRAHPDSAGNGSIMRSWPVALAYWDDLEGLLAASRLQSRVTHPHPECQAASALVNGAVYHLLHGATPGQALSRALEVVGEPLRTVAQDAPRRRREQLPNRGWVRHTVESAVWGLLTTGSFEEAAVQVVNLGQDADTAGAVTGALAGAAYGLGAIPGRWRQALQGEWPLGSGQRWQTRDLVRLADRLLVREP